MSAVKKSLIIGTLACAAALAGCGGDDGGGGGTGGPAAGAGATSGMSGGAGAGTAATSGGGGMTSTVTGGTGAVSGMTGGAGAGSGGVSGAPGGSGGTVAPGECAFDVMCTSENDIRTGAACENAASGVFAIKTVIDVWWQDDVDPPLVDPGRGYITVYLKGTLTEVCSDGSSGCGEMMGCGVELPAFASWVNCNAYDITFPDDLWEKPGMPKFYTTGSVDKFEPGGLLQIAKATGLVGFEMTDADNAAWPTSINMVTCDSSAAMGNDPLKCFPDHDGDGLPGVSIVMGSIGSNYRDTGCGLLGDQPVKFQGAPLDALATGLCDPGADPSCKRAVDLQIGVRTRLGGGGLIDACDAATGAASGKGDSDADYVDSRVAGCKLNDGTDCDIAGVEFVDSAAPNYKILDKDAVPPSTVMQSSCECPGGCGGAACPLSQEPSKGARSAVVRLGDAGESFDCATVRSMVDAQFPGTDI